VQEALQKQDYYTKRKENDTAVDDKAVDDGKYS
jgi:hypothetical protein